MTGRQFWTGVVLVALFASGCGDDGGTAVDFGAAGQDADVPGSNAVDAPDDGDDGGSGGTPGEPTASVTVGDETFTLVGSPQCIGGPSLGVNAIFRNEEDTIKIEVDIPPEDWESSGDDWDPPHLVVVDRRGADRVSWTSGTATFTPGSVMADEEFAGVVVVESFTVDERSTRGTATFIDGQALVNARANGTPVPEPVAGEFEISCG